MNEELDIYESADRYIKKLVPFGFDIKSRQNIYTEQEIINAYLKGWLDSSCLQLRAKIQNHLITEE